MSGQVEDLRDVLRDAAEVIRECLPDHTPSGDGKTCRAAPKCERCRRLKLIDDLDGHGWLLGYPAPKQGAVT